MRESKPSILFLFFVSLFLSGNAQLVINEVSQGPANNQEYVELLTVGTPNCKSITTVDLRGWIIDDNNGFHSNMGGGNGIAPGCIRFANTAFWSAIPIGTIILIYNDLEKNASIPADDAVMSDNNCRLILPVSSNLFEIHLTEPNSVSANYPSTGFVSGGNWSVLGMANSGDSFHTINPQNLSSAYHAVSWGPTNIFNNIIYFSGSATGLVYSMINTTNTDIFSQNNWSSSPVAGNESPGSANNLSNQIWIESLNNNCTSLTPLSASLATSDNVCNGDATGTASISSIGGYQPLSYTWSTLNGIGTSANNLVAGNYSVVVKDYNNCDTTINFSITSPPPLIINTNFTDSSICKGFTINIIASGAASYSFSPSTGVVFSSGGTISVRPDNNVTYTITGTDLQGCSGSKNVNITVKPIPTISISPKLTNLCFGENVTLTASGGSSYNWFPATGLSSSSLPIVVATPSISTTYTVIGTHANGCKSTDTSRVNVYTVPSISISPSTAAICFGDSVTLTASGAGSYTWAPAIGLNQTNGSVIIAKPGSNTSYTITGVNGISCISIAVVNITVNSLPNVSVAPNVSTICHGDSIQLVANGANSYVWSPALGIVNANSNPVYAKPNSAISYTVTGTDNNNCKNSALATVNVLDNPILSVNSSNICPGDSALITISGADTYDWTPSSGLSSTTGSDVYAKPSNSMSYTISGTAANGCVTDTSIEVLVHPLPILSYTPSFPTICEGDSSILVAYGANSYDWSPSTILTSISNDSIWAFPTSSNFITLSGTSSFGCTKDSAIYITVHPKPTLFIGPKDSICFGDSLKLEVIGASSYSWVGNAIYLDLGDSIFIHPSQNTSYSVSGIDLNECTAVQNIEIKVNPIPNVSIVPVDTICLNLPLLLSAQGANSYSWAPSTWLNNTSLSSVTSTPEDSITYTVTGTSISGCVESSSIKINRFPDLLLSGPDSIFICEKSNAPVSLFATGGKAPLVYNWQPTAGINDPLASDAIITSAGNILYSFSVTDNCQITTNHSLYLKSIPLPTATISSDLYYGCAPATFNFANIASNTNTTCIWNLDDGTTQTGCTVEHLFEFPGTYAISLIVNDTVNNCSDTSYQSNNIIVYPKPLASFEAFPETTTLNAGPVAFNSDNAPPDIINWHWTFNNIEASYGQYTSYNFNSSGIVPVQLVITDIHNCKDTLIKYLSVLEDFDVYIPKAFTPNGDQLNDVFEPKGFGFTSYDLKVYERWGQLIYHNQDKGWNGFYRNDLCQNDVYIYIIDFLLFDNTIFQQTGHFTLIK